MTGRRWVQAGVGLAGAVGLGLPVEALARPDSGEGLFTFDASDVLDHWDVPDAPVRVHFSTDGPNVTRMDDADEDGVPDFVHTIGTEVATVLEFYEAEGFRPPLFEADVGLGPLGGSAALDVYLVDFGGSSDGHYGIDGCRSGVCAGHLVIENDFSGYGYSSPEAAAVVLASHELFHGVQYAYTDDLDPWFSEGTATWAEHLYHPEVEDYLRFCTAYMADIGRSIDRPPAGTVTAFSYGTALYFGFLQEQLGADTMVEMMDLLADAGDGDEMAAIQTAVADAGGDFSSLWVTFMTWNLGTGPRGGLIESYPYYEGLWPGVDPEISGSAIIDDNRFYPLAATYFRLDHGGGELLLGVGEDNHEAVVFQVHPTAGSGKVLDPLLTWSPDVQAVESLGDQEAGTYWLLGTFPEAAAESEKRLFCFGGPDDMADCTPEAPEPEDTGDVPEPDDTGDDTPSSDDPDGSGSDGSGDTDKGGCATVAPLASMYLVWLPVLAVARRRR